jgi:hypothetical protein
MALNPGVGQFCTRLARVSPLLATKRVACMNEAFTPLAGLIMEETLADVPG